MSRRWFTHQGRQVSIGWERSLQRYYVNIVDLCRRCWGTGEDLAPGEVCGECGGEGVPHGFEQTIRGSSAASLDEIARALAERNIPFPEHMRADLEEDRRTDATDLVHDYDLDPRRT